MHFPSWIYFLGPCRGGFRAQAFRKREDAVHKKLIDEAVTGKASGMNTEDKPEGDKSFLLKGLLAAAIETTAISL
ncbi:hypothetical protein E4T56_gene19090 [Termitomyces sp. T112]|nr:hypothetical protein E4T56_gene19090 [Termitomyces sp. T112]